MLDSHERKKVGIEIFVLKIEGCELYGMYPDTSSNAKNLHEEYSRNPL